MINEEIGVLAKAADAVELSTANEENGVNMMLFRLKVVVRGKKC